MPRDTDSIFAHGAVIVPDFVTPAEEARILLRIAEAPWLTELRRRVQHYGFQYDYRGATAPVPAAPFPRWASVMAERLRAHFGGALPVQCIVNEYRPGQGIGMHADHADFGPTVASLSLGASWPMRFRRRNTRPYARDGLPGDEVAVAPPPLGPRPRGVRPPSLHARHRPRRHRARDRDPHLRDLPHARAVARPLLAPYPERANHDRLAADQHVSFGRIPAGPRSRAPHRAKLRSSRPCGRRSLARGACAPPKGPPRGPRAKREGWSAPLITGNPHPRTRARLVNGFAVRSRGPAGDEPCARVSPMDCR